MKEPFGHEYDSDECECEHRRDGHVKGGVCAVMSGCMGGSCGCMTFLFKARDLFQSLSQEEFNSIEGPSEDEIRDSMERGWRKTSWGQRFGPRRKLPEDD